MTSYDKLKYSIEKFNSILCVGLDSEVSKLPLSMDKDLDGLLAFNAGIIESCQEFVSSFKINFAFYEQYGSKGMDVLKQTIDMIPDDKFVIADSKRGDIGNTSRAYAKSCFEYFRADAITVSPYMGKDSISPFLEYYDKMVFVLALTSNSGSVDFQRLISDGKPIYKHVIEKSLKYTDKNNIGYVVGATHPKELAEIRDIAISNFLLIPGIGTQGGDIEQILTANNNGPAIINVSRDIIYASNDDDFNLAAAKKSEFYRNQFNKYYE